MLFVPPVVPAVGLGRFKRKHIDRIRTNCTEVNHAFPGITRNCSAPPKLDGGLLWCYDNHRVLIGHGRKTFEQAKQELQKWGQFKLDWANVDSNTSLKKGSFVCVEAQPIPMLPVWTAVPLRMMYKESATVDVDTEALKQHARVLGPGEAPNGRAQVFRYGHTCLKGHFLAGEERFQVEYHPADGSVWYDVCAVSRPATPLAVVAYPLLRLCQKRFAYDTLNRMRERICPSPADSHRNGFNVPS